MDLRPENKLSQPSQETTERRRRKVGVGLAIALDYLVSLADHPETEDTVQKVEEAIAHMKMGLDDHRTSFDNLAFLADIARHNPERKEEIIHIISDSAEILLADIQGFEGRVDDHKLNNIHVAWDALGAWDVARDPKSLSLCKSVLNNLKGVGAADTLSDVLERAEKNGISVLQAHDEVLAGAA